MQKQIPRERWLTDAAVTLSPICLFHISWFHQEKKKRHLTEDRTEQKRQKGGKTFLLFHICSFVAAGDLISAETWNNLWQWDKQSDARTNYNSGAIDWIPNNDWRLVRTAGEKKASLCCTVAISPGCISLGRRKEPLMHPWVLKWTCAEPQCWQCINLYEPKRAISESRPMRAWLFPHLQPLTAVTLNQCLWIVWSGQPPPK